MKVFTYTVIGVTVAMLIVWGLRSSARGPPPTMTKEWQEQTNEYLKVRVMIPRQWSETSNHP
jgi:cytochrome c oxidase subunit 4